METKTLDNTLWLSGVLNEETDFQALKKILDSGLPSPIRVNLKNVERANSCGIIAWFKLIRELQVSLVYTEAPVWLIEQFNMNPFFLRSSSVESFYAPFYDVESNEHHLLLLCLGKDVPLQDDYSDFEVDSAAFGRSTLEADFDSEEYFQFIVANLDELRAGAA